MQNAPLLFLHCTSYGEWSVTVPVNTQGWRSHHVPIRQARTAFSTVLGITLGLSWIEQKVNHWDRMATHEPPTSLEELKGRLA